MHICTGQAGGEYIFLVCLFTGSRLMPFRVLALICGFALCSGVGGLFLRFA